MKFLRTLAKKPLLTAACVLCTVAVCFPAGTLAAEYLSEGDPVITLSYLKSVFSPALKEEIKNEVSVGGTSYSGYTVVELSAGQILTSQNGTVELILRPGAEGVVVSDIPGNGLSDISEMREILDGEPAGINHALIIPRNDGRGVRITSEKAYVLVRGSYAVK